MKQLLFITSLIFAYGIGVNAQSQTSIGVAVGSGFSNDINNIGLKLKPIWAYKAGVLLNHERNKVTITTETGYLKTGFKDFYYLSVPGSFSYTEEFYKIHHHKVYLSLGVKIPLDRCRMFYFKPGINFQYQFDYSQNNQSNPTNTFIYHEPMLKRYNKFQYYLGFDLGCNFDRFSIGIELTPQLFNNVTDKNLRVYSYYGGVFLKVPLLYL